MALVLRFDETPTERQVVDEWIGSHRPTGVTVDQMAGDELGRDDAGRLGNDATAVIPVRVAWTALDDGERASRWLDTLAAVNARVALPWAQVQILRATPERCKVIVGAPATLRELRRRFEQNTGGADSFGSYIRRQAVLALDRAEREVVAGRTKLPRMVVEEVVTSRQFADGARRLGDRIGRSADDVAEEARGYLNQMAATHSPLALDLFNRFGRMLMRAYEVDYDPEQFAALRELNRRHALVYLPSHRSYLDPFAVLSILQAEGCPVNHTFGGANMAFWPMGVWMRHIGAIAIRRGTAGQDVYKFALRQYLTYLMRKRLNLEWYIEGGRTRTGKLRPPKYGLLAYLVDAFEHLDDARDVYLVPISIVYDVLPEVWSLTSEQRGMTKKAETPAWLVKYPRLAGRGYGKLHVNVGEPLSLRRALSEDALEMQRLRVEKVAFEVCHRIDRATLITPTALLTLALLGVGDRALTLEELRAVVGPVRAYFERRGLRITGDISDAGELRQSLNWLEADAVIERFDGGTEPVWSIPQSSQLEAAFYRNSIVHFILPRAIVELVLVAIADGRIDAESEAWGEALRLRDLFKFEFFFPEKAEFVEALRSEVELIDPDWRDLLSDREAAARVLQAARPHLAHRALNSFVEAYYVTAQRLAARAPQDPIDEDAFIRECFGVARQEHKQRLLHSSDSIATEVFRTSLRAAAHRDLLGPGGEELAVRRHSFLAELVELVERLRRMRELSLTDAEVLVPA
jgi:glycerol-3-phosphate O-acyltransferase